MSKMDIKLGTSKRVHTDESSSPAQIKKPRLNHDVSKSAHNEETDLCSEVLSTTTESSLLTSTVAVSEENEADNFDSGINKLSDDVLLILLSYLKSSDLHNVSRCNRRLYNICADKTLWNKVISTCDGKTPLHSYVFLNGHSMTSLELIKTVTSVNTNVEDTCIGIRFFRHLNKLDSLKRLTIVNHVLNGQQLSMLYLPESITELKLTGTQLTHFHNHFGRDYPNVPQFFSKIYIALPNLEVIDVSYCQWFKSQLLIPLAKCPRLKTLRMVGCNVTDFIPYASMGALFGYRSLETLDMRLTNVADREIGCFNKLSLKHIYLENPESRACAVNNEDEDTSNEEAETISDICTTSLGRRNFPDEPADDRVVVRIIPLGGINTHDHTLETLVVRNYPKVTDLTLKHAEKCLKSLKYLDVTGSSCSKAQINIFRTNRPEVELVA